MKRDGDGGEAVTVPVLSQALEALGEFWCNSAKTNPKMTLL